MKELHFYIQGSMMLIALACAVQIPIDNSSVGGVVIIQVLLGIYQYGMSWFLMNKLRRNAPLLNIYFISVHVYFLVLVVFGLLNITNDVQLMYLVYFLPWVFALFFLIVIEDLLWKKS